MLALHKVLVSAAVVALMASGSSAQTTRNLPGRFTAFAVSTGGPNSNPVASRVEITVDRWSSAGEAKQLMTILKEQGPEKLLESLRAMKPVGSIRTPGNLAYDLHFAHVEPGEDGGQRIVLATDRPLSYWEAVNRPRTYDYPFTFIELHVNGGGEGEGKLALATKITSSRDGKTLELENYESQPIQLNSVRRVK